MAEKHKIWWFVAVFIAIILLFLGGLLTSIGHKMDEYLEKQQEPYKYQIEVQPRDEIEFLSEAYIKQDFSKNKGEFSFATTENKTITAITMILPGNVTNSSIKCYNKSRNDFYDNEDLTEIKCSVVKTGDTSFEIKFNKSIFNKEKIVITYSLFIIPNARFDIFTTKEQVWNDGTGNFIINLGKDFECVGDCLYHLRYINQPKKSYGAKELHLTFENYEDKSQHSFEILTKSRRILDNKNLLLSLGISIITGSIFFILSLLFYIFYQYKEDKSAEERIITKLRNTIYYRRRKKT